jgi:hypothetical protein
MPLIPTQHPKCSHLYRDALNRALKAQHGDDAVIILHGDIDLATGEVWLEAKEPFTVYAIGNFSNGEVVPFETNIAGGIMPAQFAPVPAIRASRSSWS